MYLAAAKDGRQTRAANGSSARSARTCAYLGARHTRCCVEAVAQDGGGMKNYSACACEARQCSSWPLTRRSRLKKEVRR